MSKKGILILIALLYSQRFIQLGNILTIGFILDNVINDNIYFTNNKQYRRYKPRKNFRKK